MAIDQSRFLPEAPPLARSNPQAYYLWLTSNGFPHRAAYDQTTSIFGPPKSPEEIAKERAGAASRAGYAQAAGTVGGALLTQEVLRGFPNIKDAMASTPQPAAPSAPLNPGATATSQQVWNAGADAATAAPQAPLSGQMTQINTPSGVQQVPVEMANEPGFLDSVNWGKVGQGAMGAAQLYQAYNSFKNKEYAGGAIQATSGGLSLASSGALGAAAQTGAAEALGGYAIPGAQIAAGGYGAYQTAKMTGAMAAGKKRDIGAGVSGGLAGLSLGAGAAALGSLAAGASAGVAAGAAAGSVLPVVGTIIGAAAGYFASRYAGSKKDKGQMTRDAIRKALKDRGIVDEKFQGTLADGSTTDFGQDGSKLNTKAMNKLQADNPNAFGQAQDLGDVLAASYGFVGDKARSLARIYVKGALSNAKDDPSVAVANMQHFAKQQEITFDLVKGNLDEALSQNRIDQNEYNRLIGGAQQLMGQAMAPTAAPIPRPKKGEVGRQSAGLYRNDKGELIRATSMKQALTKAYGKTKEKK